MSLHGGFDKVDTRHARSSGDQQAGAALLGGIWTRSERQPARPEIVRKTEPVRTADATDKIAKPHAKATKSDAGSVDFSKQCPLKDHNKAASHMGSGDSDAFTAKDARALKSLDLNSGKPMTDAQMDALAHLRKHAMDDDGTGQPLWKKYAPEDPSARQAFKDQMFGSYADYQEEKRNSYRSDTSDAVQAQHQKNVREYGESLDWTPPGGYHGGSLDCSASISGYGH